MVDRGAARIPASRTQDALPLIMLTARFHRTFTTLFKQHSSRICLGAFSTRDRFSIPYCACVVANRIHPSLSVQVSYALSPLIKPGLLVQTSSKLVVPPLLLLATLQGWVPKLTCIAPHIVLRCGNGVVCHSIRSCGTHTVLGSFS
jgi:hypothetical protein